MKRDMDLCRKILFAVEDCDERFCYDLKLEGYKQEEVNYNAKLLFCCFSAGSLIKSRKI